MRDVTAAPVKTTVTVSRSARPACELIPAAFRGRRVGVPPTALRRRDL